MKDLLKILPIYGSLFLAGTIFSFVNITFWLSKLKSGIYTLPLSKIPFINLIFKTNPVFETWYGFTLAAWCFNIPYYIMATFFVGYAYKTSVVNYGVLYSAFVIGHITSVFTTMIFMYIQVGEVPNRNEWIALILTLMASLVLVSSRST